MKTKFISIAATLLLAASVNTAFANFYLVGSQNGWTQNEKYELTKQSEGVYTLSTQWSGAFKIIETFENNNPTKWYGVNDNEELGLANHSLSLVSPGTKDLYLKPDLNYTFTFKKTNEIDELEVSGFKPCIAGTFTDTGNGWGKIEMTKNSDGTYSYGPINLEASARFKITDTPNDDNNWYGGITTGGDYWVTGNSCSNISLNMTTSTSYSFYFNNASTYTIILSSDLKTLNLIPTFTLTDNTNNTSIFDEFNGKTANVVLNGRTLVGEQWNTLCLPFNTEFAGTPLAGADVRELSEASLDGGTLTLTFSPATSISAGVPYIVKPGNAIENPTFTDVTIGSALQSFETTGVKFIGTFSPETINGQNFLYLGADNKLYWPNGDVIIGAFRAYFELDFPEGSQGIKSFVLNFGDDNEETSIKQINNTESATNTYFTLDGRRLNDKPATAGLYIINGKKVVIK